MGYGDTNIQNPKCISFLIIYSKLRTIWAILGQFSSPEILFSTRLLKGVEQQVI